VESEVGSGMNGARARLRRLFADAKVTTVVVEHRDQPGRTNIELVEAALSPPAAGLWCSRRVRSTTTSFGT
jgi:putative resolvase